MVWYGWYSEREEKVFGYAHYVNKKGDTVAVTKVTQDPNYTHPYKDAVCVGRLTHFCQVKKWNCIKNKGREAQDRVMGTMEYERNSKSVFGPHLIVN